MITAVSPPSRWSAPVEVASDAHSSKNAPGATSQAGTASHRRAGGSPRHAINSDAPESASPRRTSSRFESASSGTTIAPARRIPKYAATSSGTFGAISPTRSPGTMPSAASRSATCALARSRSA
jgi:hypothetical protein